MAQASNPISLGVIAVTSAGTPVQITSDTTIEGNALQFQSWTGNANGKIYIGKSGMNKTTGVGVFYVIPGVGEAYAVGGSSYGNVIKASEWYVDADVNGEGCLICVHQR